MKRLHLLIAESTTRRAIIDDCANLVEREVDRQSGLSGLAVRGAFSVVKAVRPGFVREAVDFLLDDFVTRLEPFCEAHAQSGSGSLQTALVHQSAAVADALLGVTDDKAKRAKNATLKKAYEKLRPTAHKYVAGAVPGIAEIIARHVGA
jgi:hypothetical protein